jgi:O-antigen/teichoic acid export membrane protein
LSGNEARGAGGSFRGIVRATSLLGGASIINIVASILRTKMLALVLGPAGIGLIGLFQNLLGTASAVAGLGINTVGTRQIAEASATEDHAELLQASQALLWGTLTLATIGGLIFFLLREPLALALTDDVRHAGTIGWLSVALVATVLAGSQVALLTGLRRLRALAEIGVITAILSIVAAGMALYLAPLRWTVVSYLVSTPVITLLVGQWVILRHWPVRPARVPWLALRRHWAGMARIGFWFTITGLTSAALMLSARGVLARALGPVSLGQFQASWAISSMYLSVILQAMGSDYYPRLTMIITDRAAVNRTVNAQTEALLLMAAPIILGTLAAAPIIVHLLYSSEFAEAAWILRWQVLGDVLKLAAWPMSFVLLAAGAGRRFFLTDATAPIVMVAFLWLATPSLGIIASGLAFLVMYGVYLPTVFVVVRQHTGFLWSRRVVLLLVQTLAGGGLILGAAAFSETAALAVGIVAVLASAAQLLVRLADDDSLAVGPLARIGRWTKALVGK